MAVSVALDRVPARVRDHIFVQIDPVLVGLRWAACLMHAQCHHPLQGCRSGSLFLTAGILIVPLALLVRRLRRAGGH
jgi:hypothetical protein